MSRTMPPDHRPPAVADDYVIERDDERRGTPFVGLLVRGLRIVLVLTLAVVSLALFWLVGTMLGLF